MLLELTDVLAIIIALTGTCFVMVLSVLQHMKLSKNKNT